MRHTAPNNKNRWTTKQHAVDRGEDKARRGEDPFLGCLVATMSNLPPYSTYRTDSKVGCRMAHVATRGDVVLFSFQPYLSLIKTAEPARKSDPFSFGLFC